MLSQVHTGAVLGIDAFGVQVEVNLSPGLPSFTVVGLAQGSVREGRERVSTALRNSGFDLPLKRITVNLAPADVRKEGTAFDLPIAVGILAASGAVESHHLRATAFFGELGLDGSLRSVPAVLPLANRCRSLGMKSLVVPSANVEEAGLADGISALGADSLRQVVRHLRGQTALPPTSIDARSLLSCSATTGPDLEDVRGQSVARRALEIAAAGSHNMLMIGPPGSGKTMLAHRIAGILPPLELREAIEVTEIHSVAGLLQGTSLVPTRPFRAPHHSVSYAGLIGGGASLRPGEISLAHNGVLFLDELPEYRRNVLEVLRQPMEEGAVTLSRARGSVRFPSRFLLIAAMNPCPCGHHGDGSDRCVCDVGSVSRYRGRVSGPLIDRMDLTVEVPAVPVEELGTAMTAERSEDVRSRVRRARVRQAARFGPTSEVRANAHMAQTHLRAHCRLSPVVSSLLRRAASHSGLSARGFDRVLRVSRTIADLVGDRDVGEEHVAEALQYRGVDRTSIG
jgi:magnesium chelatase family protein